MIRRRSRWLAGCGLLLFLAAFSSTGCGETIRSSGGETQAPAVANFLLISIDTLRADHLGCYGHGAPTSPHLDRLATDGVLYRRALAPTPWTLPSHGAMLTGVDPYLLGLTAQWRRLPGEVPTLAEVLRHRGYQTAAFVDSVPRGFVGAKRGFDRGFETFQHAPHGEIEVPRYDIAASVDAALGWLAGRSSRSDGVPASPQGSTQEEPFFLFLHSRSVHAIPTDEPCRDVRCSPYFAPLKSANDFLPEDLPVEDWDNDDGRRGQDYLWWLNERLSAGEVPSTVLGDRRLDELRALYEGAIHYTDQHLGRLFAGLEAMGLDQSTWVVVTSDHGEAFLENRLLMHQEVHESSLRVPLIVRPPQDSGHRRGVEIEQSVTLEDIPPTVLKWATNLGGETETTAASMTGRPLPLVTADDTAPPRALFAYYLFPEKFDYRAYAIEFGDRKLVAHNPENPDVMQFEFFSVGVDGEHRVEGGSETDISDLRQLLRQHMQRQPLGVAEDPAHAAPVEGSEALSTLGYID